MSQDEHLLARLAKMPSGDVISAAFLSSLLEAAHRDTIAGRGTAIAPISALRIDEDSVIEGRHSTTFRLLLDRHPTAVCNRAAAAREAPAVAADHASGEAQAHHDVGPPTAVHDPVAEHDIGATSLFVKTMYCKDLPARSLSKWRTSIASYRAEATFFKTIASSESALHGIVPRVYWVHVDDRLGYDGGHQSVTSLVTSTSSPTSEGSGDGDAAKAQAEAEETTVEALRESSFMMITEDLRSKQPSPGGSGAVGHLPGERIQEKRAGWEQVGAMDIERAKLALSAAARLHAAFWPNPLQLPRRPGTPSIGSTPPASTPQPLSSPHISSNAAAHRSGHEEQSDHGRGEKCRTEDTKGCDRSRRFPRGLHEQGTFWSLEKRDPADLQGLVQEYENLLKRFRPVLPDSWFLARQTEDTASVSASDIVGRPDQGDVDSVGGNECRTLYPEKGPQTLGRRIAARARELDAAAHGGISGVVGNNRGGDMRAGGEAVRQRSTRGMTLVHGDLKTWNVFFKIREPSIALLQESPTPVPGANADAVANSETSSREEQVKFIDWQWCGEGLAAADVAYIICTSLEPSALALERELLAYYYSKLGDGLEKRFGAPPETPDRRVGAGGSAKAKGGIGSGAEDVIHPASTAGEESHSGRREGGSSAEEKYGSRGAYARAEHTRSWYPMQDFVDDYRVAFLDYMRCVLGTLWKGQSPEKMEINRLAGPGMSLINRSVHHFQWMIEKATRLLDELDDREKSTCDDGR